MTNAAHQDSADSLSYQVLEQLVETSLDPIQISDETGRFLYLNKVALDMLGIDKSEANDLYFTDIEETFEYRGCEKWQTHIELLKSKKHILFEGINKNLKTGELIPVEASISYKVINNQGIIVASIRDISLRKELQLRLFKNTKSLVDHYHLVSLIHAAVNNIFLGNIDGAMNDSIKKMVEKHPVDRIEYFVNQEHKKRFVRIASVSSSRLEGLDVAPTSVIVQHKSIDAILQRMLRESVLSFHTGFDEMYRFEGLKKDKAVKSAVILPLVYKNLIYGFIKLDYILQPREFDKRLKRFIGIYGAILNSSLQVEVMGRELQRTNLIFNQISESSNDVFFLYELSTEMFDYISPKITSTLGVPWREFMSLEQLSEFKDLSLFKHSIEVLRSQDYAEYEFKVNVRDEEKCILQKMNAIRDEKGSLINISGLFTDITYQKKATFELTKSLELISQKNQELEDKNQQIHELLKRQEADLYIKTVKLSSKTGLLSKVESLVNKLNVVSDTKSKSDLSRIKKYLNEVMDDRSKSWEELRIEFEKIRPNFFKNLNKQFKGLSPNDLKHCYYVVTGLNSKETANLLSVTPRTIETARYRLKKKFSLGADQKLLNFLQDIAG